MSAETLHRAAALMRERAKFATPGPWVSAEGTSGGIWVEAPNTATIADIDVDYSGHPAEDAEHIASWHPAVALAVATWLDGVAARVEVKVSKGGNEAAVWSHEIHALAVARAYLGEQP